MFFQCVKSVTNRDGTATKIVMINSQRIIAAVCLTFDNLLFLIYFEWWKQFSYIIYKKHVERKSIWNDLSLIISFSVFGLYIIASCITHAQQTNDTTQIHGTWQIVSHGSFSRCSQEESPIKYRFLFKNVYFLLACLHQKLPVTKNLSYKKLEFMAEIFFVIWKAFGGNPHSTCHACNRHKQELCADASDVTV